MRRTSRREILTLGGAAALAGMIPSAGAQTLQELLQRGALGAGAGAPAAAPVGDDRIVRIGVVVPAKTGLSTVATSITDYIGESGRMGAVLAEALIGEDFSRNGWKLELHHSNTPLPEAAARSVQRMVETGNLCAVIGGIGDGQAEAISKICERGRLPFFNIGESADSLRGANCGRYTFHIEASAAMYLDAMTALGVSNGVRRWFIMHEDSAQGRARHARAVKAIAKHGAGGTVVGSAAVERESPVYYNEFNAIGRANADGLMLLTYSVDQIAILSQLENTQLTMPVINFPDTITQTRDYIATVRALGPKYNPRTRIGLWESTLTEFGAAAFNEPYMSRWSEPVDPTGWGSYAAIKMIAQAVRETNSVENADIVRYFERQDVTFDIGKGPGVNFRSWDHQMRQPLYTVDIDQEVEWVRIDFTTWVALGKVTGALPAAGGQNLAQRFDQYGDGPTDNACRMPA